MVKLNTKYIWKMKYELITSDCIKYIKYVSIVQIQPYYCILLIKVSIKNWQICMYIFCCFYSNKILLLKQNISKVFFLTSIPFSKLNIIAVNLNLIVNETVNFVELNI